MSNIAHFIGTTGDAGGYFRMKQAHPIAEKDYSGLFVGAILTGLVVIVFVLMMAVSQSRARSAPLRLLAERTAATVHVADSALTPTIYSRSGGTN